jgi:hypothetical protein
MAQQLWQTMTSGLGQTEPGGSTAVETSGYTAVTGWRAVAAVYAGTVLGALAGAQLVKRRKLSVNAGFMLPVGGALLGWGAMWAVNKFQQQSGPNLSGYRLYG